VGNLPREHEPERTRDCGPARRGEAPRFTATETEVEIRQLFEAEDIGPDFTPELREQEERLRAQVSKKRWSRRPSARKNAARCFDFVEPHL